MAKASDPWQQTPERRPEPPGSRGRTLVVATRGKDRQERSVGGGATCGLDIAAVAVPRPRTEVQMKRGSKLKKRRGKTASQNSRELRLGRMQASSTIGTATVTLGRSFEKPSARLSHWVCSTRVPSGICTKRRRPHRAEAHDPAQPATGASSWGCTGPT
jgi:hypothetical protein